MQFYFDTSALVKYYHPEIGSDKVKKIFQTSGAVLQVSNLGILEVQSAFGMKVRTQQITPSDAAILHQRLLGDIASEIVRSIHLGSQHVSLAGMLFGKYWLTRRMRTLDALQLAIAVDLPKKSLLDVFVVADRLLSEVALLEGLSTLNPEDVQ